jgi:hypothetical protein
LTDSAAALRGGLGIAVRFSKLRPYLGNVLIPSFRAILPLVFLFFTFGFRDQEAGPVA